MSTAPGTPRSRAVGWLPQRVLPTVNYSPVSPVSDSPPSLNSERASNSEKFSKQINIPRWPQEPQKLHRGGIISALSCLGDIVVILISIVFFVYGGIVLKYDGVATASILYKAKLIDAARYVRVSHFPITTSIQFLYNVLLPNATPFDHVIPCPT